MKLRIRDKWNNRRNATLEENANVLAYNIWQLALAGAKNLHAEEFDYTNDKQRVGVIREYLMFLVHIADRLAYPRLNDEERGRFVTRLAQDTARQLQRNQEQVMGSGDYKSPYIDDLNTRMATYAKGSFDGDKLGYSLLRNFGEKVQAVMGSDQTNRWVIDQVMEIDALDAVENTAKTLNNLLPPVDESAA
ncbi:MAG: hypothetical protein U9Q71_09135 [Pseudomonadota bacterium]|nr:hypothetical protein [Pseudomonadota bacterium]